MRKTKVVPVPATTRTRLDSCTCDLCGKSAPIGEKFDEGSYRGHFKTATVERVDGARCEDGGHHIKLFVDICPECFSNELIPWLKSRGVEMQSEEIDW